MNLAMLPLAAEGGLMAVAVIAVILLVLVVTNIQIVPQARAFVIERLGAYHTTWDTGLHVKIPVIDRVAKRVSLKEAVVDFPPQPVITKDNVTMQIDTVVYYQITDSLNPDEKMFKEIIFLEPCSSRSCYGYGRERSSYIFAI